MSNLLTLTNLPREVNFIVSHKSLFYIDISNLLTKVTNCFGKYFFARKSLILLKLTNLPNFPPYRGYRGVVSNPPHTPYVTIAKESKNYA